MTRHQQDNERDATLNAARYRLAYKLEDTALPEDEYAQATGRNFAAETDKLPDPVRYTADQEVWEVANSALDAAFARGDFDNLAYAGKPIPGLGTQQDPDWWVKGMMEREKISGVGPPALLLRKEDAELESTLDALVSPTQVRELLEDFNSRIINARRQLAGGPPVITKLRDIEIEVQAWEQRGASAAARVENEVESADPTKPSWFAKVFGPRK